MALECLHINFGMEANADFRAAHGIPCVGMLPHPFIVLVEEMWYEANEGQHIIEERRH